MAKEMMIELVEIDLGIDIKEEIMKAAKDISDETKEAANKVVAEKVAEKVQKDAAKKEKNDQKTEWTKKLEACYATMFSKIEDEDPFTSAEELLKIADTKDLTGLMLRIKNFMKKLPSEYKIKKIKRKKKTYYKLFGD